MHGYAAPQTKEALARARALISNRADYPGEFAILYGLWAASYVGGGASEQLSVANEFLAEAQRQGDSAALSIAHRAVGTTLLNRGDFTACLPHLSQARALYNPERHSALRHQYGQDIGAAAQCYLSWALWHLGSHDQADAVADEALRYAQELSHPHTLVYTLAHVRCFIDIFRRSTDDLQSGTVLIHSICTELGFSHWISFGRIFRGWAAVCRGEFDPGIDELLAGIAGWQKTGSRLWLPMFHTLAAEAYDKADRRDAAMQSIEQALAASKETGEKWAVAEVLRIKAQLVTRTGKTSNQEIEHLLRTSLNFARRQGALSFELRISLDLARLWQRQGKLTEALLLVRKVYAKFTEGFATRDLRQARALTQSLEASYSQRPT